MWHLALFLKKCKGTGSLSFLPSNFFSFWWPRPVDDDAARGEWPTVASVCGWFLSGWLGCRKRLKRQTRKADGSSRTLAIRSISAIGWVCISYLEASNRAVI